MAVSRKVVMGVMLMVVLAVVCMPSGSEAIRGLGVAQSLPQVEVGDLSLEEQQQVMTLQEDMEAIKRRLLSYDPYYTKWYGGKH